MLILLDSPMLPFSHTIYNDESNSPDKKLIITYNLSWHQADSHNKYALNLSLDNW
jgi:hypothetical protein